jgi:hypothetical protein
MMQLFQNANGYKSGVGKITADNIVQAIQKLDGNQLQTKQCQSLKIIIFSNRLYHYM